MVHIQIAMNSGYSMLIKSYGVPNFSQIGHTDHIDLGARPCRLSVSASSQLQLNWDLAGKQPAGLRMISWWCHSNFI